MTSTASPSADVPDTTDMIVVHRLFRREFRRLPEVVAAAPRVAAAGDAAGLARIVDHTREVVSGLHHHHLTEDKFLWPLLAERASFDAGVLARMEGQHAQLGAALDRAAVLLEGLPATAADLVEVLRPVPDLLEAHLDEEERVVLPEVRRVVSTDEWSQLGDRGLEAIPAKRRLVALGHILDGASTAERQVFLMKAPLPARLLFPLLGERRARRERAALDSVLQA
ncbi:hemerythrin domain-containing protein [Jatrophihabitans fulvus]